MSKKNEVAAVEKQLEEITLPDLNLPGVIELRDSVLIAPDDIPDTAAVVLALTALGYGAKRVASICGISRQGVYDYLERYDPKRKCRITDEDRRLITTQMMRLTAVEALMNITHEKLKESSAKDLADIATRCAGVVEKMELSKKVGDAVGASRLESMLDALDVPAEVK